MSPLTPSQFQRFEELVESLARVTASEAERILASESDERVARLVRLASLWRRDSTEDLYPGFRFEKYELEGKVGEGGLGVVYRARETLSRGSRAVAVKFIRPTWLRRGAATASAHLELFESEIARLLDLSNPYIVRILNAGRTRIRPRQPEVPWYSMELLVGDTPLNRCPYWPTEPAQIEGFLKVCEGMAEVHRRGILHLDLTPANIRVLPDGNPRIIDFGLGAVLRADRLHRPELIGRGTIAYRPPEMLPPRSPNSTSEIDARADVHALGVLFFELLTGHLPYDLHDGSEEEFHGPIASPHRFELGHFFTRADKALSTLVSRATATKPADRFRDAAEFHQELKSWAENRSSGRSSSRSGRERASGSQKKRKTKTTQYVRVGGANSGVIAVGGRDIRIGN